MAKENSQIQLLVTAAIAVILVAALISAISNETQDRTKTETKTETLSLAGARLNAAGDINITYPYTLATGVTNWRNDFSSECLPSTLSITNGSDTFTVTTDYTYTKATASLTFANSTAVRTSTKTNTTTVSYPYCPDDYMTSSWGRSLLNLTPGFIAIALLIAVVFLAYQFLGKTED